MVGIVLGVGWFCKGDGRVSLHVCAEGCADLLSGFPSEHVGINRVRNISYAKINYKILQQSVKDFCAANFGY